MEETNYLTLYWKDKIDLVDFVGGNNDLEKKYSKEGVYIHTVAFPGNENRELLAYIGKAKNLYKRQQTHYAFILGGLYRIPKDFRNEGESHWTPEWNKEEYANILRDMSKYMELVKQGYIYAGRRSVYLCIKDQSWNNNSIRDVERNLLYKEKPYGTKIGTKSCPKNKLDIKHNNANWISARREKVFDDLG